jgi:hypothetical protein
MMRRAALLVLGALLFVGATAGVARAGDTVTAKVPFPFIVNGIELPAGDYVLSRSGTDSMLMIISRADGRHVGLVLTQPIDVTRDDQQPKLDFERVGQAMYLTQITFGYGEVCEVPAPAAN